MINGDPGQMLRIFFEKILKIRAHLIYLIRLTL